MNPVEIAVAAIAVVGFLGSAVVFLRGSKDKGTIETLRQNNEALEDRVRLLEAEGVRQKAEIKALAGAKAVLETTVNSSAEIAELRTATLSHIDDHHKQVLLAFADLRPSLTRIENRLGDILTALEARS